MFKQLLASILFVSVIVSPSFADDHNDSSILQPEELSQIKRVTSAKIAPNGKYIAYTKSNPRKVYKDEDGGNWNELYVTDAKGNSRAFITGEVSIGGVSWSPNSDKIYFLTKRGKDKFRTLYAIAIDGGEAQKVFAHSNNIAGYKVSDGKLLFWAKDKANADKEKLAKKGFKAKVYEEDIQQNQLWLVDLNAQEKTATSVYSKSHVIGAQFAANNTLVVKESPTSLIDDIYMNAGLHHIDMDGKVLSTVKHVGKMGQFEVSNDNKHIALIGTNDMHDPSDGRLMIANMKTGELTLLLTDFEGHVKDIEWLDNKTVGFVAHIGTETVWASKRINKVSDSFKTETRSAGIILSASVDGKGDKVALLSHKPEHPNEVYLVDGRKTKRLTNSNPWLANKQLAKQETIKYKARNGLELEGILVHPLNGEKNAPLIIYVHGGPEAHVSNGWVNRYSSPVHYAASKGYYGFFPNYRGSTGRGVEFSKMGQGKYAAEEFDDIVDAKDHLVKLGLVDSKKVGITGGSYGGYASAWGATALTEHYAASVMFVGISDQLSKFGTTDIPTEMFNVHARSWPWDKWQWMLERSPIYHAEKARTPILIMHGEEDTRVHPSQSMELYRYLKVIGKTPVRLVLYPGEGHGNRRSGSQLDYSLRLMRWMDNYLMGSGDAMPPFEINHAEKLKAAGEEKK